VLGIFAHPDDESLACGGTLARLADAGCRVVIVCASHGEAGSISDPSLVPDGDLGRVRVRELSDAAAVLGAAEVSCSITPTAICAGTSARAARGDRRADQALPGLTP